MSDSIDSKSTLTANQARTVDKIADVFESTWRKGKQPSVRDFLRLASPDIRDVLFHELSNLEHRLLADERKKNFLLDTNSQQNSPTDNRLNTTKAGEEKTVRYQHETPSRLGQYKPTYELGRGSSGVVYAATGIFDLSQVAIKVPFLHMVSCVEGRKRFQSEIEIGKRLVHPNIVRFIESHDDDTGFYIVYELLHGIDLKSLIKTGYRLSFRQIAFLVLQASRTLQYAHEQGVIHRDISPSNIMLILPEHRGELATGAHDEIGLKILDFGIAKALDGQATLTNRGAIMGTPFFMSPEQASGQSKEVTERSDIYSLGAVFFQLLIGKTTFQEGERSIFESIRTQEVPSLIHEHLEVPKQLATLCQRCLRLNPDRRFQSMSELGDDLQRYLNHERIRARPVSSLEKATSYWNRNRTFRQICSIAGVSVLLIGALTCLVGWRLANEYRDQIAQNSREQELSPIQRLLQFPDRNLKNKRLVAKGIASATADELVKFVGLKNTQPDYALDAIRTMKQNYVEFFEEGLDKPFDIGLVDLLLVNLDSEVVRHDATASTAPEHQYCGETIAKWILETRSRQEVPSILKLSEPVRNELAECLEKLYKTETLTSNRLLLAELLASSHSGDLESLLRNGSLSRPEEAAIWGRELAKVKGYSEILEKLSFDEFDKHDHFSTLSEEYCEQRATQVLIAYAAGHHAPFLNAMRSRIDPRLRTYAAYRFARAGISPDSLILKLAQEENGAIQYGILIALAQFDSSRLTSKTNERLRTWVVEHYEHHPDAGVHGMCHYLLEEWKMESTLEKIDERLIALGYENQRNWFLSSIGITFTKFVGPVSCWMGRDSKSLIMQNRVETIPYSYAIATETIKNRHVAKLQGEEADAKSANLPAPFSSYVHSHWVANQLNQAEGYPPISIEKAMESNTFEKLAEQELHGYRLPTSPEWEYAARALSETYRFFGTGKTDIENGFLHDMTSRQHFEPNRFGLSDIGLNQELTCSFIGSPNIGNANGVILLRGASERSRPEDRDNASLMLKSFATPWRKSYVRLVFIPKSSPKSESGK